MIEATRNLRNHLEDLPVFDDRRAPAAGRNSRGFVLQAKRADEDDPQRSEVIDRVLARLRGKPAPHREALRD